MSTSSGRNTLVFALTAFFTVALDQAVKAIITATIEPGHSLVIIPRLLVITYSTNTGAAFGLLRGSGQIVLLAALVVIVMLLSWFLWSKERTGAWSFVGLGLIMGGAVGNLADRIFRGRVVDFIDIGWWPVFNIADVAIVAGVIIVLVTYGRELWRAEGEHKP